MPELCDSDRFELPPYTDFGDLITYSENGDQRVRNLLKNSFAPCM